jgi:hypothetical protein
VLESNALEEEFRFPVPEPGDCIAASEEKPCKELSCTKLGSALTALDGLYRNAGKTVRALLSIRRWRCFFPLEPVHLPNDKKHHEGYYQEFDNGIDEHTVVDCRDPSFLGLSQRRWRP